MPLSTPVILLIFRRPDLTAWVFETIRQVQPTKLLVIADGPFNKEEEVLCQQSRAITEEIDWPCEVFRNYSEVNMGCRKRVSSGITWAFEQVEEAIVLEDDCLPSPAFFEFCQILLDYYRNDERIWMISGDNFQNGQIRGDGSYYFSRYPHCWGWATWKRAWKYYQDDLATWPQFRESGLLKSIFENPKEVEYWTNILDLLKSQGKPDSWAYRWAYTCWSNSGLTILPNQNLVTNVGFGSSSTNTKSYNQKLSGLPADITTTIQHPKFIVRNMEADDYTSKTIFLPSESKQPLKQIKDKFGKESKNLRNFVFRQRGGGAF